MNELPNNEPSRRAVLRITHDVDVAGHVLNVRLEPLAPPLDAIEAAWNAAHRCHPWIVGDAEKIQQIRAVAIDQVLHLMSTANEVLFMFMKDQKFRGWDERREIRRMREAVIDLGGCMPALRGEVPKQIEIPTNQRRRAG